MSLPRPDIFQQAAMAALDADRILRIKAILEKLRHHHASQAKQGTPACSKEYHAKLTAEIDEVLK